MELKLQPLMHTDSKGVLEAVTMLHQEETRILILAERQNAGVYARKLSSLLESNKFPTAVCDDMDTLIEEMKRGAGALIVTKEDVFPEDHRA